MSTIPTQYDNIIDSRYVDDAIAQLERELEEGDDRTELEALRNLAEQGRDLPDWEYGVTLVRESYFEDYAQEFAEDIGAISHDLQWPLYCIDWERAADDLRMDYTELDFAGITYYAR